VRSDPITIQQFADAPSALMERRQQLVPKVRPTVQPVPLEPHLDLLKEACPRHLALIALLVNTLPLVLHLA